MKLSRKLLEMLIFALALIGCGLSHAQTPPSEQTLADYSGLLKAAATGNAMRARELLQEGSAVDVRDNEGRTPLHVAAYAGHHDVMRALVAAGADPNAMENDDYDIVTIAAVADDVDTLKLSLELGASPGNVTSRYEGTALIAASHLGHDEVVRVLIDAGAPLDHVNNLTWTAVIEAIVLGDGGDRHQATLKALIDAGADLSITDRDGLSPLTLAKKRGYVQMVEMLEDAGAK